MFIIIFKNLFLCHKRQRASIYISASFNFTCVKFCCNLLDSDNNNNNKNNNLFNVTSP